MRLRLQGWRSAVVFAPHPDDEIIGAAALIQALRQQGSHVTVVIVSDGSASHPASKRWPRNRLVGERKRESRRALHRLGVMAGDVLYLGMPDGALERHQTACRRSFARICSGADLIVGPSPCDDHPDHRAVAAALRGIGGAMPKLTYRVWPPHPVRMARERMVAMRGGWMAKRSLIALHRTQSGRITDDPGGFAISRHELAAFAHPIEAFGLVR